MRHDRNTRHSSQHRTNRRPIDVNHVCEHLTWLFKTATRDISKSSNSNDLYAHQVDFAYYLDNIQRGPTYIVPKIIAECNEFIDKISNKKTK